MSEKILIAEDSEEVARFTDPILSGEGFTLVKCSNALEAVRIIQSQAIKVVVCNEAAPKLSGSAISEIIRKTVGLHTIPIILISEDADVLKIGKLLERKIINFFLPRPFSSSQLITIIGILLKNDRGEKSGLKV